MGAFVYLWVMDAKGEFVREIFPDVTSSEAEVLKRFVVTDKHIRFVDSRGIPLIYKGKEYNLKALCESLCLEYPL